MNTLSVDEAAVYAKRHRVTLWRHLESGELHGSQRKAKGRWVIRVECLDAWMAGEKCEHQTSRRSA